MFDKEPLVSGCKLEILPYINIVRLKNYIDQHKGVIRVIVHPFEYNISEKVAMSLPVVANKKTISDALLKILKSDSDKKPPIIIFEKKANLLELEKLLVEAGVQDCVFVVPTGDSNPLPLIPVEAYPTQDLYRRIRFVPGAKILARLLLSKPIVESINLNGLYMRDLNFNKSDYLAYLLNLLGVKEVLLAGNMLTLYEPEADNITRMKNNCVKMLFDALVKAGFITKFSHLTYPHKAKDF